LDFESDYWRGWSDPRNFKAMRTHNVSTRMGCKEFDGEWVEPGVCMLDDFAGSYDQQYGFTAPIHGVYFYWHLFEDEDPENDDDRFEAAGFVGGCIARTAAIDGYPYSGIGLCHQVYGKYFRPQDYVGDVTRDHMIKVAYDSMNGKWAKHDMEMMQPPKKPHIILPDKPYLGYRGIEKAFSDRGSPEPPFKIKQKPIMEKIPRKLFKHK
jgi:hypothetical protein